MIGRRPMPLEAVREDPDVGVLFRAVRGLRTMLATKVDDPVLADKLVLESDEAMRRLVRLRREHHHLLKEHSHWGTAMFGTMRKNAKRVLRESKEDE